MRCLAADPAGTQAIRLAAVAEPPGGTGWSRAVPVQSGPGDACWSIEPQQAVYPDGTPIGPRELLRSWTAGLRDPIAPARFLLDNVNGLEDPPRARTPGLNLDGEGLVACVDGPARDFPLRLQHPGLWPRRRIGAEDLWQGAGPFVERAPGVLERNPSYVGTSAIVERVDTLPTAVDDPLLWLELEQADLAVVYGRDASRSRVQESSSLEVIRAPGWDTVYYLWLDASARWLNDPTFRRWLAGSIDRASMLDYLFDGQGEQVFTLIAPQATAPVWAAQSRKPVSPGSRPVLKLYYDEDEAAAPSIAARLRAALELEGIELRNRGVPHDVLLAAIAAGEAPLSLLAHHPPCDDPLLGLVGTIGPLGPAAEPARRLLRQAMPDAESRLALARMAEHAMLLDAHLVPLVRLDAWIVHRPGLHGITPGSYGRLGLERAGWLR